MPTIELLSPAKDLACGIAAIDCGADAVYIGAPRFSAREAAANSTDDIAALARHAHKFRARVYAALNTLLTDAEIPQALRLIEQLHAAGVDGLIIQDTGLLECPLPPLPLIASTQMHNNSPEKIAFLEKTGFQRAILARELTLEEIRAIRRAAPSIELECFIHGALCVCYSGQCYLSHALGGRSGNRGVCAQPCRKAYQLLDTRGRVVREKSHLLSLRDLNLTASLGELLDAGVTSFKIEGRLKDKAYVMNNTAHYRAALDALLPARGLRKSSSGVSVPGFQPNPAATFNRGYTAYFLHGRGGRIGSLETPKMLGQPVGKATGFSGDGMKLDGGVTLHPGDGLCFFDRAGVLRGTLVNGVHGATVVPDKKDGIEKGTRFFRNHDHAFLSLLQKARPVRRVSMRFSLGAAPGGLKLTALDEDGARAEFFLPCETPPAEKPEQARDNIRRQLEKTGGSDYACEGVDMALDPVPFAPVSALNALRRGALEALDAARAATRPVPRATVLKNSAPYPEKELSYQGNVLNAKAEAFYRRHGVERIEPAAEAGTDLKGRVVMTTRYCLKEELGLCPRQGAAPNLAEPLALVDEDGRRLELRFDCGKCGMEIYLGGREK